MAEPSELSREPLAPDAAGYCYVNEQHFDETIARVARDHFASRAGLFERLVPWALAAALCGVAAAGITLGAIAGLCAFVLAFILLALIIRREGRHTGRIERFQHCFHCGYALLRAPTDADGWGTCPECGARFNAAYYRRPPAFYVRSPT